MDVVLKKITSKLYDKLTYEDCLLLDKYYNNQYELTKKIWTFTKINNIQFYWPEKNTSTLLEWSRKMVGYYMSVNMIKSIKVTFNYIVKLENDKTINAYGKYVHYDNNMNKHKWNIKKKQIKEFIRKSKKLKNENIISISIHNVNVKNDDIYESDDEDGESIYAITCKETKSVNNLIKIEPPQFDS